ncbi:PEBP-like protein [Staphylotrichum tortipilum]|uniref:PEBP-like protein n=1 Tax=Staphylotrichum tortipilum TaxID=2831512 RepID=A0AAN6MRT2_9PEZI|nr:PEBP-like protein [Staphylotrichum longicolle]
MANPLLASLRATHLLPSAVIPADFNPMFTLTVHFPASNTPVTVSNGTLVRVNQVREAPIISVTRLAPASSDTPTESPKAEQKVTLMLLDPDAPTPDDPKFAYWRHWVVSNISLPGNQAAAHEITGTGRTLTEYLAPGPKDESGPHRYLFLLFLESDGGLVLEKGDVGGEAFVDRRSFGVEAFVERCGLRLVAVEWMRGVGDGWVGE